MPMHTAGDWARQARLGILAADDHEALQPGVLSIRAAVVQKQRPVWQGLEARRQHGHGDEVPLKASGRFMCA